MADDPRPPRNCIGHVSEAAYTTTTGLSIFRVRLRSGETQVLVVASDMRVVYGEEVNLRGAFTDHVGIGRCFEATEKCLPVPSSADEANRMLAEGMGLPLERTTQIYARLGDRMFDALDRRQEESLAQGGMRGPELRTALENWQAFRQRQTLWVLLTRMDIHGEYAEKRLRDAYGQAENLAEALHNEPHMAILALPEADWATIEAVADELGVDRMSEIRRNAALVQTLRDAADSGNTFLPKNKLEWRAAGLLGYTPRRNEWDNSYNALTGQISQREDDVYLPEHFSAAMSAAETALAAFNEAAYNDPPTDYRATMAAIATDDYQLAERHFSVIQKAMGRRLSLVETRGHDEQLALAEASIRICDACRLKTIVIVPSIWASHRLRQRMPAASIGVAGDRFGVHPDGSVRWESAGDSGVELLVIIGAEHLPLAGFAKLLETTPEGASIMLVGDPNMDVGYVRGRPFKDLMEVGDARVADARLKLSAGGHCAPLIDYTHLSEHPENFLKRAGAFRKPVSVLTGAHPEKLLARYAAEVMPRLGFDNPLEQLMVLSPRTNIRPRMGQFSTALRRTLAPESDSSAQPVGQGKLAVDEPVTCQYDIKTPRLAPAGTLMTVHHIQGPRGPVAVMLENGEKALITTHELPGLMRAYVRLSANAMWQRRPVVALIVPDDPPVAGGAQVLYTAAAAATEHLVLVGTPVAVQAAAKKRLRDTYSLFGRGLSEQLIHLQAQQISAEQSEPLDD